MRRLRRERWCRNLLPPARTLAASAALLSPPVCPRSLPATLSRTPLRSLCPCSPIFIGESGCSLEAPCAGTGPVGTDDDDAGSCCAAGVGCCGPAAGSVQLLLHPSCRRQVPFPVLLGAPPCDPNRHSATAIRRRCKLCQYLVSQNVHVDVQKGLDPAVSRSTLSGSHPRRSKGVLKKSTRWPRTFQVVHDAPISPS